MTPNSQVRYMPEDRFGDPREESEWFLRLPEHAKEELRQRWRVEEGRSEHQLRRRRATRLRYLAESAGLFAAADWLFSWATVTSVVTAFVFGAAVGALAMWRKAGLYLYMWAGALGYTLFAFTIGMYHWTSMIVSVVGCAAFGAMHQLHRSDGTE